METNDSSRHPRFWIEDGNVIFRVQNSLYKVHQFFFKQYSPVFRDMFSLPLPSIKAVEGETEQNPIILHDQVEDFDHLLNVFYPSDFKFDDYKSSDWLSVLKIAHKYQMEGVRLLAAQRIKNLANPVDMIFASRLYGVHQELLVPALEIFCKRKGPITVDEARALGGQDVLFITRLKSSIQTSYQEYQWRPTKGLKISNDYYSIFFDELGEFEPLYTTHFTDDILDGIMKKIPKITDRSMKTFGILLDCYKDNDTWPDY